jgi:hypothetical protein
MNRRAIAALVVLLLLLALALLVGPCVLTATPVDPSPEPRAADDTASADVTG